MKAILGLAALAAVACAATPARAASGWSTPGFAPSVLDDGGGQGKGMRRGHHHREAHADKAGRDHEGRRALTPEERRQLRRDLHQANREFYRRREGQ